MKAFAVETEKTSSEPKTYNIGLAEQKIAKAPDRITTLGLGSCIGLVLYDPVPKIGSMVHIMLPCAANAINSTNRFKYADTAIEDMIKLIVKAGALQRRLLAKMAGGAHMFKTTSTLDILNVGLKNADMCKRVLNSYGITLCSEDTGGNYGRSIEFCCETGKLWIRTATSKEIKSI